MGNNTLRLAALAVCLGVAACTDSTGISNQDVTGTYLLQTVNGNGLPYVFNPGTGTVSVQADRYTLNNDGSYIEVTDEILSNGSPSSLAESGNWSRNGNEVTFNPTSGGSAGSQYFATVNGGSILGGGTTLTISGSNTVSVYVLQ